MDRITVAYDPDKTEYGVKLKDDTGTVHFGPGDMHGKVRAGDILDVTRTLRPENPKFPGDSYKISKWKVYGNNTTKDPEPTQRELYGTQKKIADPPRTYTRPRTDPADQRQMWVTALMKEWMAAYSQSLSITTTGEMKKVDAGVMEQAARACGVTYDRLFGPMTQSNKPPEDEDMNDEIGF